MISAHVAREERGPFFLLAFLLFAFTFMLQSNEVAATSGLISQVGVDNILWVWAGGMLSVLLTSTAYSVIVDRFQRSQLIVAAAFIGALAYGMVWLLFAVGAPQLVSFLVYYIVIVQHMALLPLALWTFGNDAFAVGESRRLFPVLVIISLIGGMVGNFVAAGLALVDLAGPSPTLLINVGLGLILGAMLPAWFKVVNIRSRQSRGDEHVIDTLREGVGFLRDVPAFRFLGLIIVAISGGYTTIEYLFLSDLQATLGSGESVQAFYGFFKVATLTAIVLVQLFGTQHLARIEFRGVFAVMPATLLLAAFLALFLPGLWPVVVGNFLSRVVLQRVELPARKSFQGLVPDERRGRVSAFLDGILYPSGAIVGTLVIGGCLALAKADLVTAFQARSLYLLVTAVTMGFALWAVFSFSRSYDSSMLNWRLQRKRNRSDIFKKLDL
jgi:ABC-type multidrug transport system fused ATPase/permease subunit